MKYKLLLLSLLVAMLWLNSCSSGKKAYERGDYYEAVLKSVNRLRQHPGHRKSQETLRKSYPMALQSLEKKVLNLKASHDPFRWKKTVQAYEQINYLYEEINRSPAALQVIPQPRNYYQSLSEARRHAAEESYQEGLRLLQQQTREGAKSAVFHFSEAGRFMPGYKDVDSQLQEAEFMATLKVVVEQLPVPGFYSLSADFFQDRIEAFLLNEYRGNRFVRFYTPEEARNENLQIIDQYLQLQFDNFVVGQTYIKESNQTLSRDSVHIGEVARRDGSKKPVYGTVTAKLKLYRKEIVSKGLLSMRVIDANSTAVLMHRKFPGEFVWFSEWASFNGDERALSKEQLALCNLRELPPPPPQNLFIEFTKPIFTQLSSSVKEFYRRY